PRAIARARSAARNPMATTPYPHLVCAVLCFRNVSVLVGLLDRMALDLHSQPLFARIEARALGYRPALQCAIELQAEVVVEPPRCMLLHNKMQLTGAPNRLLAFGLAGLGKIALAAIRLQAHARLRSCCGFCACACDLVERVAPR